MRIAYLILCHTDPLHIGRLVSKITDGTDHYAFVHVDAKVDVKPFADALQQCSNAVVLKERTKVYWGGTTRLPLPFP